jgi:hypothetical protein
MMGGLSDIVFVRLSCDLITHKTEFLQRSHDWELSMLCFKFSEVYQFLLLHMRERLQL